MLDDMSLQIINAVNLEGFLANWTVNLGSAWGTRPSDIPGMSSNAICDGDQALALRTRGLFCRGGDLATGAGSEFGLDPPGGDRNAPVGFPSSSSCIASGQAA